MRYRLTQTHLLLCLLFVICCGEQERSPSYYECDPVWLHEINTDHPKGDAYQEALAGLVAEGIPGAIMLIKSPQDGIWFGAAGKADLSSGVDMRVCNKSRVASVTKTFMSALTLKMAEADCLSIDDLISDYIPNSICENIDNCMKATIRQALGHTAGLPCYQSTDNASYWLEVSNDPEQSWTRMELLEATYGLEAPFEAGHGYDYTNVGYILLSYVIDDVAGQHHEDVLQHLIFDELFLQDTSYRPNSPDPEGLIRSYRDRYGDGVLEDSSYLSVESNTTAGGIVSTVYDIARFIEELAEGHLISQNSLAEMKKGSAVETNDWERTYGLGLNIATTNYGEVIGHLGGLTGYNTTMFYFTEKQVTFILFVNGESDRIKTALDHFKQFSDENPTPKIFRIIFQ